MSFYIKFMTVLSDYTTFNAKTQKTELVSSLLFVSKAEKINDFLVRGSY